MRTWKLLVSSSYFRFSVGPTNIFPCVRTNFIGHPELRPFPGFLLAAELAGWVVFEGLSILVERCSGTLSGLCNSSMLLSRSSIRLNFVRSGGERDLSD